IRGFRWTLCKFLLACSRRSEEKSRKTRSIGAGSEGDQGENTMQLRTAVLALAASVAAASLIRPAIAQVVNFHDANNGVDWSGNDPDNGTWNNRVYIGQGAYPDPGHNTWNGFGGAGA